MKLEIGQKYKEEFDLFKYNLKFFYVAMGQWVFLFNNILIKEMKKLFQKL